MDPDDRADLVFDLAELMDTYEDEGYTTSEVRDVVIGYANGRNSTDV